MPRRRSGWLRRNGRREFHGVLERRIPVYGLIQGMGLWRQLNAPAAQASASASAVVLGTGWVKGVVASPPWLTKAPCQERLTCSRATAEPKAIMAKKNLAGSSDTRSVFAHRKLR